MQVAGEHSAPAALEGGYSAVAVYRGAVDVAPAGDDKYSPAYYYSQLKKENIEILPYQHSGHFHSFQRTVA